MVHKTTDWSWILMNLSSAWNPGGVKPEPSIYIDSSCRWHHPIQTSEGYILQIYTPLKPYVDLYSFSTLDLSLWDIGCSGVCRPTSDDSEDKLDHHPLILPGAQTWGMLFTDKLCHWLTDHGVLHQLSKWLHRSNLVSDSRPPVRASTNFHLQPNVTPNCLSSNIKQSSFVLWTSKPVSSWTLQQRFIYNQHRL